MISIPNPDADKWRQRLDDQYPPKNLSTPEPMPKPNDNPSIHDLVIKDIEDRKQFGIEKYGTILQSGNGRKTLKDAYQEVLDLAAYLRLAIEEQLINQDDEQEWM